MVMGSKCASSFKEISRRLVNISDHQRAGYFVRQMASFISIQRGNAASLLTTFSEDSDVDEDVVVFYFIKDRHLTAMSTDIK